MTALTRRVAALGLLICVTAGSAQADSPVAGHVDVGAAIGTGIERGAGRGGSAVAGAPVFLDINARTYPTIEANYALGASLRVEMTGAASIALVPRAELRQALGELELRPGLGVAMFLAPMSLIGPELSLGARLPLAGGLGLQALVFVDAFVAGSNLPRKTTLIQVAATIGIDMRL